MVQEFDKKQQNYFSDEINNKASKGFTLLELIIALSLVSISSLLYFHSYQQGARELFEAKQELDRNKVLSWVAHFSDMYAQFPLLSAFSIKENKLSVAEGDIRNFISIGKTKKSGDEIIVYSSPSFPFTQAQQKILEASRSIFIVSIDGSCECKIEEVSNGVRATCSDAYLPCTEDIDHLLGFFPLEGVSSLLIQEDGSFRFLQSSGGSVFENQPILEPLSKVNFISSLDNQLGNLLQQ